MLEANRLIKQQKQQHKQTSESKSKKRLRLADKIQKPQAQPNTPHKSGQQHPPTELKHEQRAAEPA